MHQNQTTAAELLTNFLGCFFQGGGGGFVLPLFRHEWTKLYKTCGRQSSATRSSVSDFR